MANVEKSPFSDFDHIGIVVRDVQKTVESLESLGIGPFERPTGIKVIERTYRGKPGSDIRVEARVARMGPVKVELLQPVSGKSPWKDFLDTKGEGINHVAFHVNDLNELNREVGKLEKQGMEVIFRAKFEDGGGGAYVDAKKAGGLLFEFFTLPASR